MLVVSLESILVDGKVFRSLGVFHSDHNEPSKTYFSIHPWKRRWKAKNWWQERRIFPLFQGGVSRFQPLVFRGVLFTTQVALVHGFLASTTGCLGFLFKNPHEQWKKGFWIFLQWIIPDKVKTWKFAQISEICAYFRVARINFTDERTVFYVEERSWTDIYVDMLWMNGRERHLNAFWT